MKELPYILDFYDKSVALEISNKYGYSIMERIKLAGFDGDKMLNMPIIAFAGEETLKTK